MSYGLGPGTANPNKVKRSISKRSGFRVRYDFTDVRVRVGVLFRYKPPPEVRVRVRGLV